MAISNTSPKFPYLILLIIGFVGFSFFSFGQNKMIDSLLVELGKKDYDSKIYWSLSEGYEKEGDWSSAIFLVKEAFSQEKELSSKKELSHYLFRLNKKNGTIEDALFYLEIENQLRDSLKLEEQNKLVLETKVQSEWKEMENEILRAEADENLAIFNRQKNDTKIIFLSLVLLVFISIVLYCAYHEKNKFNQNLKKQVEERTVALQKSISQLEKSNQELESFAYIASHDLKEPIRNIGSFTNLALRSLKQGKEEEVEEYISFVKNNSEQMYLLIQDVLEFAKIGNAKSDEQTVGLMDIVHKVDLSLRTVFKDRNVVIEHDMLPVLSVNPTQWFILFKNLIENGIKYNESVNPKITIRFQLHDDKYQKITVSDNGVGIPQKYQERVFEMFKRLHNRMEYKGSGLGLSICKKIVERIGGKIHLHSVPGKGSTFIILIPIENVISSGMVVNETTIGALATNEV